MNINYISVSRDIKHESMRYLYLESPKFACCATLPLVHIPHARTNAFKSSFVPSSVSIWNNLPHEALIAPTITSFISFTAPLFLFL